MSFARLEAAQLGRSLAQIGDAEADHVDLYLERLERVEVPEEERSEGFLACREAGLAVRLLRAGKTWLAARDRIGAEDLRAALRQVARAAPRAAYLPEIEIPHPWEESLVAGELVEFPRRLRDGIQRRNVAFPARFHLARHRRWIQVVGTKLLPDAETEEFFSLRVELPWGRHGFLLADLDGEAASEVEETLVEWFGARRAEPPPGGRRTVILAPAASAVFLHEAVAHALEADTLALGGPVEAACGVRLGAECLAVLDDPGSAPAGISRATDDEGMPAVRRWLVKEGRVREPLADLLHAGSSVLLSPGAGRRSSRHLAPVPRSYHLELVPGEESTESLLDAGEEALYFSTVLRASLDAMSGEVEMHFPFGRRVSKGGLGAPVGPCRLRGTVADLLSAVEAVGRTAVFKGAGWCGKGGQRLPVWATCPGLRLGNVEVGT